MSGNDLPTSLLIAGSLGLFGALLRALAELFSLQYAVRASGTAIAGLFSWPRLLISGFIGICMGVAAAFIIAPLEIVSLRAALIIVTAAYALTDLFEKFLGQSLPRPIPRTPRDALDDLLISKQIEPTIELNELARPARPNAQAVVYAAIHETIRQEFNDDTKLDSLGFDVLALAGLAVKIRRRGIPVDTGAVQSCESVGDVVKACRSAS
jgi:hypothetical protein